MDILRHWSCRVRTLLGLLALAGAASAVPDAMPEEKTLSPYFFVENGDPNVDRMPLASTKVDVAISGVVAEVTVTQRYTNAGKRPLNARYVFPASTRAAVHGLSMTLGKQRIVAKIKEREAAKKEYIAHQKAGKNAALLEEDRPNVFTMSVANVMPGETIDVTLDYSELLVPTDGTYEFVYPTVVGPRYSNSSSAAAPEKSAFVASPYLGADHPATSTFDLEGTLSTATPIGTFASPTHKCAVHKDNATLARFSLDDSERLGKSRDFVVRYGLAGDAIESGLSLYEAPSEKFFQLVVEPPKRVLPAALPAREYVFVLDVSGSMEGFPLETAKELLHSLTEDLGDRDRFNVVLFSGASHVLSARSLPATSANVKHAMDLIDHERGGGGTELLPALEQAMSLGAEPGMSRSFVVVTDGYIEQDKNAIDYVRAHLGDANVFAFGIGESVNRYLIEGVAKAGQGEPFVVMGNAEAKDAAARFKKYVAAPVLTHVRVAYDGFDAYDTTPEAIPDVFASRPVILQGKWRGKSAGKITVSGISGAGAYEQVFDVSTVSPRPENRALASLWARTRVASLSDFGFGEETDAVRAGVTALGLKYDLLTPYTSFIAVSEVVRNPGALATNVDQPLPLPDGVSADAVGTPMQPAPEPGLLCLCAFVAGALALQAFKRRAWGT